jgi:hypothetical protein
LKSIQDKKLGIKILIICHDDLILPRQIENIKSINLSSVIKYYAKILYENNLSNWPNNNQGFYEYISVSSEQTKFEGLSKL